jgi:hypothetical protein
LHTELDTGTSLKAAAGWKGDRFHIYLNADGQKAWVLRLAWETPKEEQEFATAYATFGQKRFGATADANGCWSNSGDALCMKTLGQGIVLAQGPSTALAQALIAAQSP